MHPSFKRYAASFIVMLALAPSTTAAQPTSAELISLQEGLGRELNTVLAMPAFATELDRARKQFPALTTTTQLLIAYTGYLGRARPTRFDPSGWQPPFPPIGPPHVDICKFMATMCRCRAGDREACISLAEEGDDGPGLKVDLGAYLNRVPTCDRLQQQYREALEAILALLRQSPLTSAQLQELAQGQSEANTLYEALVARGCLAQATSGRTGSRNN